MFSENISRLIRASAFASDQRIKKAMDPTHTVFERWSTLLTMTIVIEERMNFVRVVYRRYEKNKTIPRCLKNTVRRGPLSPMSDWHFRAFQYSFRSNSTLVSKWCSAKDIASVIRFFWKSEMLLFHIFVSDSMNAKVMFVSCWELAIVWLLGAFQRLFW